MYILCRNFDVNCILCEKLVGLEKVTKLGVWPQAKLRVWPHAKLGVWPHAKLGVWPHAKLRVRPHAMISCETKFAPPVTIRGYEGPETGG